MSHLGASSGLLSCLNPITHDVCHVTPTNGLRSLQQVALSTIRKAITIRRFDKLGTLPLPHELINTLSQLCISDFWVRPDDISAEHHRERLFPATCLIDNSTIYLSLTESEPEVVTEDPAFLGMFECADVTCIIYDKTITLEDKLANAKESGSFFSEAEVWRILLKLAEALQESAVQTQYSTKLLHFLGDKVFLREAASDNTQAEVVNSTGAAVYSSPEELMRMPDRAKVKGWVLGCLAHELAALEPAFYDREGSGNVMAVMMGIIQGNLPPRVPDRYSDALHGFIQTCLTKDLTQRPEIQQLTEILQEKVDNL